MNKKRSKKIQKKYDERKKNAKIASILEEQFQQGKLLGESLAALVGGDKGVGPRTVCQSRANCRVKAMGCSYLQGYLLGLKGNFFFYLLWSHPTSGRRRKSVAGA